MTDRKINMVILHCSATKATQDFDVATIRRWHTDPPPAGRGWADIGYHFVIKRNGVVENGRDLDGDGDIFEEVGAHTVGYNKNSVGICLIGGIDKNGLPENNFTPEQFKSLIRLLKIIKAKYPKITIHGHNEFAEKACPSFDVQEWLKGVSI